MRHCLWRTASHLSRSKPCGRALYANRVPARWLSSDGGHKWSTPLAQQLAQAIATTGPVSVASFMRQCLTSDLGGYYTSQSPSDGDQFGAKGDFVTSPEISQIFGELIGLWIVAEWISQGRKSHGIYLMEVGPGRGTLMDDMLRTIRNFPDFVKALDAVYMVEASPKLRRAQHSLLCGSEALQQTDIGFQSTSKTVQDLKIVWTEDVRFVPRAGDETPFVVAHEFFDALPIHVFQSRPPANKDNSETKIETPTGRIALPRPPRAADQHQWRELLVSPKPPHRLNPNEVEFELSLSRAATAHSMYLPETSSRYQALKDTTDATIEISPESQAYVRDFAERIGGSNEHTPDKKTHSVQATSRPVSSKHEVTPIKKDRPSGAALIMDYGQAATIPSNSLRGIRSHEIVSPFDSPGATDVSADVDFLALAETALNGSPGVEVHGPVDQARFLTAMGIESRANQLVKQAVDKARGGSASKDRAELTETAKRIESGWRRLVDTSPQGMGRLYQVMAILPYNSASSTQQRRRPVGFGGDVTL